MFIWSRGGGFSDRIPQVPHGVDGARRGRAGGLRRRHRHDTAAHTNPHTCAHSHADTSANTRAYAYAYAYANANANAHPHTDTNSHTDTDTDTDTDEPVQHQRVQGQLRPGQHQRPRRL